jgi:hypothetical protein
MEVIMRLSSSLRTAILAAASGLLSAGAQAGPMPTNVAAMKSMVDQSTTEVRWGGGWRGGGFGYRGVGFRGGGWGYRGGGWGYRGLGYSLAAGALVGGAIASSSYYGGYGGYYGGGYPSYSYAAVPSYSYGGGYGYGYGGSYCPPYGGYARYYGW